MKEEKLVMVTGASGFLGRNICESLLDHGYMVRALVRALPKSQKINHPALSYVTCNLLDAVCLDKAFKDVAVTIHLAGVVHVNNVSKEKLFENNVSGTRAAVQAATKHGVRRFLYMSSTLAGEMGSHNTSTFYGETKQKAEELVLAAHDLGHFEAVILRPANVYGIGMRGNIASLITLISSGLMPPLPLFDTRFSMVGVKDLSEAVILASESNRACGQTYIVTDGNDYNLNDIEASIYRVVGRKSPTWRIPNQALYAAFLMLGFVNRVLGFFRVELSLLRGVSIRSYDNLTTDRLYSSAKIRKELGFKPTLTFHSSLNDIVDSKTD